MADNVIARKELVKEIVPVAFLAIMDFLQPDANVSGPLGFCNILPCIEFLRLLGFANLHLYLEERSLELLCNIF